MNKNFKRYVPSDDAYKERIDLGVIFIKDEVGYDWYNVARETKSEVGFAVFDESNNVVAFETDITKLFPENFSFSPVSKLPKSWDFPSSSKQYVFNPDDNSISEKTYSQDEMKSKTDKKIKDRLASAISMIAPYQFAEQLGIETDEEKEKFDLLKKYIVELNRIPSQDGYPENVEWPLLPE